MSHLNDEAPPNDQGDLSTLFDYCWGTREKARTTPDYEAAGPPVRGLRGFFL